MAYTTEQMRGMLKNCADEIRKADDERFNSMENFFFYFESFPQDENLDMWEYLRCALRETKMPEAMRHMYSNTGEDTKQKYWWYDTDLWGS